MGNPSVADFPPHIQKQMREKFAAEDARRIRSPALQEAAAQARREIEPLIKRKSKYGNTRTPYKSVQGFTVMADSKLEARMFARLDKAMVDGHFKWWIPHPRFPLPGGVVYEADALAVENTAVIPADGCIHIYDAKGRDTQASINKRKQVKDLFGIDVELVRK